MSINFPFSFLVLPDFGLEHPDQLPLARGYFSDIAESQNTLVINGWMVLPESEIDSTTLFVNGARITSSEALTSEGLAKHLSWIPHAVRAGFQYRVRPEQGAFDRAGRIDVLGYKNDQPAARISTLFRLDDNVNIPIAPVELRERVIGNRDARFFRVDGLKCCGEFLEAAAPHCDLKQIHRVLDWGCGCGRVTTYLLDLMESAEVFGCDIDADAIAWCQANLPRGNFATSQPWPPLPYPDGYFDLVISYSVFTHLTREAQAAWLAEMQRILAPGGLLLASTHGPFAASFAFPTTYQSVLDEGIYDETLDTRLDGIAPEGYYRLTYQTPAYTHQEWSQYFDILAYIERGIGNFHDLVVLKYSEQKRAHKPAPKSSPVTKKSESITRSLNQDRSLQLEKEYLELQGSYRELEHWAHGLERTVLEQQARLNRYERFSPRRWLGRRTP